MTQVSVCSVMLNRPVRTRMPGGVGGGIREDSPYPIMRRSQLISSKTKHTLRLTSVT
ncbi:hypothetical protein QGP82_29000 [Leptothoe sp. LEGE 181152]|nr:hypothetical protein [Leptothoe sp. LEGE 181152]